MALDKKKLLAALNKSLKEEEKKLSAKEAEAEENDALWMDREFTDDWNNLKGFIQGIEYTIGVVKQSK